MTKRNIGKLILITVAFLLVIGIITREACISKREVNTDVTTTPSTTVVGERITRAEAFRLFSFFFYTSNERGNLERVIAYTDTEPTMWYDEYINAVVSVGLLEMSEETAVRPLENLTCGDMRDLLVNLAKLSAISYADIIQKLPDRLRITKVNDEMLLEEFLYLYDICRALIDERSDITQTVPFLKMEQKNFFVLNTIEDEKTGSVVWMATEDGAKINIGTFQDYTDYYIVGTSSYADDFTVKDNIYREYPMADDYIDKNIQVILCGSEIVYIKAILDTAVTLSNAWVIDENDSLVHAYINGQEREFIANTSIDGLQGSIADITITGGYVTDIAPKTQIINGKVLLTGTDIIEIEGYGALSLDENYKIYKIYDELSMERTNSILVGYTITDFVISEGKICAALIKERIKADNIRVLISKDTTENYYHEEVILTADRDFTIEQEDSITSYHAGDMITVTLEDFMNQAGRMKINTVSENGKISILTISRAYGTPSYRGTIELFADENGLLIINDLSLEEYLYSVVPSEMPTSFGEEAAKVQAVCARSYVYKQLLAGRYSSYGANVDDTVNCQVYNNIEENETSIFGVKDTYGKVLEYEGNIITAYYFSTSCGYTSSIEDVWGDASETEYFTGQLQIQDDALTTIANKYKESMVSSKEAGEEQIMSVDLSEESRFREFIDLNRLTIGADGQEMKEDITTWDETYNWYRWHVTLNLSAISKQINATIDKRYQINPSQIVSLVPGEETITTQSGRVLHGSFESVPVSSIGQVLEIEVLKRAESGIILELLLIGTEQTIKLLYQTNIRTLLAPVEETIYLANDTTIEGFSLMPSAFFYLEPVYTNGIMTGYEFIGGGYGHGVGMSQNAVQTLILNDYDFEEILQHYYHGIEIGFIY